MHEYIEKNKIIRIINYHNFTNKSSKDKTICDKLIAEIANVESDDVRPINHAKWYVPTYTEYGYVCTYCGAFSGYTEEFMYCPNCGAATNGIATDSS